MSFYFCYCQVGLSEGKRVVERKERKDIKSAQLYNILTSKIQTEGFTELFCIALQIVVIFLGSQRGKIK
jgi:hypothetical protein